MTGKVFLFGVVVGMGVVGTYYIGYNSGQDTIEYQCKMFRAFTHGNNAWSCERLRKEEEPIGPKRPARDAIQT